MSLGSQSQSQERGGFLEVLRRRWSRVPTVVRAVALGSFVTGMGTMPWVVLSSVNLQSSPLVPWSVALVVPYLYVYWRYLGGRWWPAATSDARARLLRARPLPGPVWRWALAAGVLGWIAVLAARVFFDTFFEVPGEKVPPLAAFTLVWYAIVTSAVAGVAEEAGFRGYLQGPIEERHGPVAAILVAGGMFWLAHLASYVGHWWWFLGYAWYYLAASAVFGVVAWLTRSILPGIVVHTFANLLGFSVLVWWRSPFGPAWDGSAPRGPVLWTAGALAAAFAVAAVWAARRLARETRPRPLPGPTASL